MQAQQFVERIQTFFTVNPNMNAPGVNDAFAVLLKEIASASERIDVEKHTFYFADGSALRVTFADGNGNAPRITDHMWVN